MSALVVFLATFVTVFALGLQSRIVNQGQYVAAGFVSLAISSGSLFLYEILARPTGWDRFGYYAGGVIGITASIWFHKRTHAWLSLQLARWKARRAASRLVDADEHRDVGRCGAHTDLN